MGRPRKPMELRFWPRIRWEPCPRPELGDCAIWTGPLDKDGYAIRIKIPTTYAHRVLVKPYRWAYETYVGPIPEGYEPDHLCRVPACVNFLHLEPVTSRENVHRSMSPAGINARKSHCVHGHDLSDAIISNRGRRRRTCKLCKRASGKRQDERRKIERRLRRYA